VSPAQPPVVQGHNNHHSFHLDRNSSLDRLVVQRLWKYINSVWVQDWYQSFDNLVQYAKKEQIDHLVQYRQVADRPENSFVDSELNVRHEMFLEALKEYLAVTAQEMAPSPMRSELYVLTRYQSASGDVNESRGQELNDQIERVAQPIEKAREAWRLYVLRVRDVAPEVFDLKKAALSSGTEDRNSSTGTFDERTPDAKVVQISRGGGQDEMLYTFQVDNHGLFPFTVTDARFFIQLTDEFRKHVQENSSKPVPVVLPWSIPQKYTLVGDCRVSPGGTLNLSVLRVPYRDVWSIAQNKGFPVLKGFSKHWLRVVVEVQCKAAGVDGPIRWVSSGPSSEAISGESSPALPEETSSAQASHAALTQSPGIRVDATPAWAIVGANRIRGLSVLVENHSSMPVFIAKVLLRLRSQAQVIFLKDGFTGETLRKRKLEVGDSFSFSILKSDLLDDPRNGFALDQVEALVVKDAIGRDFELRGERLQNILRRVMETE
jgi:hypothetical protein